MSSAKQGMSFGEFTGRYSIYQVDGWAWGLTGQGRPVVLIEVGEKHASGLKPSISGAVAKQPFTIAARFFRPLKRAGVL